MRILILGAGAIGGYIGAGLTGAGAEVRFLARGERLKQLKTDGLIVQSPLGDIATSVRASDRPDPSFAPHVVLLTCKAPALEAAIAAVAPCITDQTRILPFLNGVSHIETLRSRFPENEIWGGIAHGALTLRPDGVVAHLSPFFSAIVGNPAGPGDDVAISFVETLKKTGMDARLSDMIVQDMWNKFVFLTTLAGMTCLMRASVGTILQTKDGLNLVRQHFNECLSVARKEGFPPDAESVRSYLALLTQAGSSLTSSMLRDVESNKETECDHILGDMLERAARHGLSTPLLTICQTHLQCYEAMRRSRNHDGLS
ncbi:MAG: ketopantoate reductase family protein [Deltaproteobacteria bacterium]